MIPSSPGGVVGTIVLGATGISCTCLYAIATGFSPVNGGLPVSISYSTMPSE